MYNHNPFTLQVTNGPVHIGSISLLGITSASSLLLGDTESITLYSYFDTPPESLIVKPLAPLPTLPDEDLGTA